MLKTFRFGVVLVAVLVAGIPLVGAQVNEW